MHLQLGFSEELPYAVESVDRVLSAFMFHHLKPSAKKQTLAEIRRVLAPSGSFHLVDFVEGNDPSGGLLAHIFFPSDASEDNPALPALMSQAGFADWKQLFSQAVIFGRIAYYKATLTKEPGATVA